MRNVKPGSIQAVVREAIGAVGGLECASNDLGVSVSNLSRASSCEEDRPGGLGVNHLHRLGRIMPEAAVPIAWHFAALAGGIFLPMPNKGPTWSDISSVMKEIADVVTCHAEAHSPKSKNPNDFTPPEAVRTLVEIDEAFAVLAAYRAALMERAKVE